MSRHSREGPFRIEIIVEGHLDHHRAGWFDGMELTIQPEGCTCISGLVPDQSALFSLISRIRDLGLKLISVKRIQS